MLRFIYSKEQPTLVCDIGKFVVRYLIVNVKNYEFEMQYKCIKQNNG